MSKLYLVPTPIGNLGDMTFRAVSVLKKVAFILAEDTRTSGKLLKYYKIVTKMHSHHMHNEHKSIEGLVERIRNGDACALISDAGTPSISDPGFLLTRACIKNNIEVDCLPGATALIPGLVNSGLPNNRFSFEGFLPVRKGRRQRLQFLADETRTMVFYESTHKLIKTLEHFIEYFGADRSISVSRELTKVHEETIRGTVKEVFLHFTSKPPRGELVIVVDGKK